MRKVITVLALIIAIGLIFSGCGKKAAEAPVNNTKSEATVKEATQTQQTQTAIAQSAASFPLTLKDDSETEMTIEKKPEAIISLTLGSDEVLMDLVDKSRIKALTYLADDPGISNIADKAKGIGERVDSNSEKIITLNPDLVIIDTWANPDFVKQVRDAGIKVYIFKTPSNYDEQKVMIEKLAKVTGEEQNGKKMTDWMDGKLKEIEDKLSTLKPEQKLKVMDYGEMGSSGKGTNFDDIITRAGMINVVSEAGIEGWQAISKEKIIEMNPDVMMLPSWIWDKKQTVEGFADTVRKDKSLAGVNAIKSNRLVFLPNPHVSAISQYVVLGIEDAAKAAYPELFK